MTDVEPRLLPKGYCACECGLFGLLRKRPEGHVRGCTCPRCRGGRNRQKGDAKARQARKRLRIPGALTRHEEHWGGAVRVECKAGASGGANKVWTAYQKARAQSDASKAIGDTRPFCAGFAPDGTSRTLFVVSDDDLDAFVLGCATSWGYVK